ncbi:MAG: hypothetical protein PHC51_08930 [bacterium]|nr:hypothetical protein [bacterium]
MNDDFSGDEDVFTPLIFSRAEQTLMGILAETARRLRYPLYLVGGLIRDRLLGLASKDFDFLIEGDLALFLALGQSLLEEKFPNEKVIKEVRLFKKYRTAKVFFSREVFAGISQIDFAGCRSEHYPHSGAPPIVVVGNFRDDMLRRDFSVNALALRLDTLDEVSFAVGLNGLIIAESAGLSDLSLRQLRIHHELSFVDDPARIIRALRFISRLGFSLEEETAKAFYQAIATDVLSNLPDFRLRDELRKTVEEDCAFEVLCELEKLGLLRLMVPLIGPLERLRDKFAELDGAGRLALLGG